MCVSFVYTGVLAAGLSGHVSAGGGSGPHLRVRGGHGRDHDLLHPARHLLLQDARAHAGGASVEAHGGSAAVRPWVGGHACVYDLFVLVRVGLLRRGGG